MMRRFSGLILLLLWVPFAASAQKEGDVWFFGRRVLLDFQSGSPTVSANGVIFSVEGSSSLSDAQGNLLFHTNGWQLYNQFNQQVPGWPFASTPFAAAEAKAQGTLLLPVNDTLTLCFNLSVGASNFYGNGGYYVEINPRARSDSGAVTSGVIQFGDSLTEQMAAVRHADGESWWVLLHYSRQDVFVKLHIDTAGNVSRTEQPVGNVHPHIGVPYNSPLVFNPQGNRLVLTSELGRIDYLSFDRCTGELELLDVIDKARDSTNAFYGLSFSPSGRFLYVSDQYWGQVGGPLNYPSKLFQYDVTAPVLQASERLIWTSPPPCEPWWTGQFCRRAMGGHKLGPEGKIYIGNGSNDGNLAVWDSLSVIHAPDQPGLACDFRPLEYGLPPGTGSSFFPNIPNYRLGPLVAQVAEAGPDTSICPGSSVVLGVPDTSGTLVFTWWTGNGTDQTLSAANAAQPTATPITSTTYYLLVEDTTIDASCSNTLDSVRIELYDTSASPTAYVGPE
ncbi:MAG: hypothetical protein AAGN35_28195, partial [Bacteroidota bacterium]